MASITRALSKVKRFRCWLCLVLLGLSGPVRAEAFVVQSAGTRLSEHVYLLDAFIDYRFSPRALEALDKGVPLTIRLDINVNRVRNWWPDLEVAALEQRYRLRYHAFSAQYLVQNLNSGALYTYPSLQGALEALGSIRDFPLLDEKLVEREARYEAELRVSLDIEALPSPLRLLAYITPAWHLGSDWYEWSLTP